MLQWVWQKLPHVKEWRTKDLLISVIASALYYNNALTISLLQQQNQLPAFLTTWGKVSPAKCPYRACGDITELRKWQFAGVCCVSYCRLQPRLDGVRASRNGTSFMACSQASIVAKLRQLNLYLGSGGSEMASSAFLG